MRCAVFNLSECSVLKKSIYVGADPTIKYFFHLKWKLYLLFKNYLMFLSYSEISQEVFSLSSDLSLNISYRQYNRSVWDDVLRSLDFIPVSYSNLLIDYYLSYQRGLGGEWLDISLILHHNNKTCGVWPLSLSLKHDEFLISSHGVPIIPPLLTNDLASKFKKKIIKNCQMLLVKICQLKNILSWESSETFSGDRRLGFSQWHLQAMAQGAKTELQHNMYVDLSLEMSHIKSYFRKSYKSLISSGQKLWQVNVLSNENQTVWAEFQALHVHIAGKQTRCQTSWDLQYQAIIQGDAFLIYLTNDDGVMVGAGFFHITRDEAVYAVGVYKRSLFDKPLGHVVQYRAIEEMKLRGIRWYKLGLLCFPSEQVSDKELSIAHFKKGFSMHVFPQFNLIMTMT